MPRGKKKTAIQTIEEQIQKTDADIMKYKEKIKELEAKKNSLTDAKKKQEINSLYDRIQESGKSVDDIIGFLEKK